MIDFFECSELIEQNFRHLWDATNRRPEYLGLDRDGTKIIMKHVIDDEYVPHLIQDAIGKSYGEQAILEGPNFKDVNTIEDLIDRVLSPNKRAA